MRASERATSLMHEEVSTSRASFLLARRVRKSRLVCKCSVCVSERLFLRILAMILP